MYSIIVMCCSRTPSAHDLISPRVAASSGSRRRRRRKNSQSDSKRQSPGVISPIPHCLSPVETTPRIETVSKEPNAPSPEKVSPELFTPVSNGRRSSNVKNGRPLSGKADKARTKLLGRFEMAGSQEGGDEVQVMSPVSPEMPAEGKIKEMTREVEKSPEKLNFLTSVVQPVPSKKSVKGGWANLPKKYVM